MADPSIPPPDGQCYLLTLPPELRSTIFEYAYAHEGLYRIQSRRQWERSRMTLHGWHDGRTANSVRQNIFRRTSKIYLLDAYSDPTQGQPFPDSPLLQLAVCKQYYAEAVEAFFRSREWHLTAETLDDFLFTEKLHRLRNIRSMYLELGGGFPYLTEAAFTEYCARMEALTVKISASTYDFHGFGEAREWPLPEKKIRELPIVKVASSYRNLRRFRVVSGMAFSDPERSWARSLEAIENFVRKRMKQTSECVVADNV